MIKNLNGMEDSGLFSPFKPNPTVNEEDFVTASCIKKYPNPVLTYKDVPYRSALTFNAGVIKQKDRYVMVF